MKYCYSIILHFISERDKCPLPPDTAVSKNTRIIQNADNLKGLRDFLNVQRVLEYILRYNREPTCHIRQALQVGYYSGSSCSLPESQETHEVRHAPLLLQE